MHGATIKISQPYSNKNNKYPIFNCFGDKIDIKRYTGRSHFTPGIKKQKAVPLQAWSSPEGSRKLRFPDYMTTAQDGGKVVSLTHRLPLPPGNAPGTHFC
jgi:hypothetical protein